MPLEARRTAWDAHVDHLLISAPNLFTSHRIRRRLQSSGTAAEDTPLGLKVSCRQTDWKLLIESIGTMLSEPERRDTHVARIVPSDDPMALHRAIFRAPTIEQISEQLKETWLYEVLDRGAIAIHLQPIVQYPPGRVHGYECLMRGVDADGKLISPARMFRAARKLNLLYALDEKSRLAAVRHAAAVAPHDVRFFVNFLPTAIYDPNYCLKSTLEAVKAAGLRPDQVVFEVVETEDLTDRKHLVNILKFYRKQGFKIALDDVGAGYASLLSLSELRPDYIKLDGELVRRGARSALEGKIVQDLAEAARQNGIITIAEGVETDQELRFVLDSGIRITQGYYHAKPHPEPLNVEQAAKVFHRIEKAASAGSPSFHL